MFAWLRPNDLVWNYVVNNYLLGKEPPAFDILYWNQDTVRLAAGLHRDFIHIGAGQLVRRGAGALEVLGHRSTSGAVDLDSYLVAGRNDHIVPWENAYRSAKLLGGSQRFVLSTQRAHPGAGQPTDGAGGTESRSSYRVSDGAQDDLDAWFAQADVKRGSWWPDYSAWLAERSGELRPAPGSLGSRRHKASAKAPGSYVHAS